LIVPSAAGRRDDAVGLLVPLALYQDRTILSVAFTNPEQVPIVRADLATGELRTIAEVMSMEERHLLPRGSDEAPLDLEVFPPLPIFSISPSGRFAAVIRTHNDEAGDRREDGAALPGFSLSVLTAEGDTVIHRTYAVQGERITRSAADSLIEARASRIRQPDRARLFRSHAWVPPFWPPLKGVTIGDNGTTWVHLHDPGVESKHVVLHRNGDIVGIVMLPPRTVVAAIGDGFVWCLESDENDVQSLVRCRFRS
jgi:hypothetical protein